MFFQARGVIDDISPEVYKSLDAATSFLQIGVTGIRKGEIVANVNNSIHTCILIITNEDVLYVVHFYCINDEA